MKSGRSEDERRYLSEIEVAAQAENKEKATWESRSGVKLTDKRQGGLSNPSLSNLPLSHPDNAQISSKPYSNARTPSTSISNLPVSIPRRSPIAAVSSVSSTS